MITRITSTSLPCLWSLWLESQADEKEDESFMVNEKWINPSVNPHIHPNTHPSKHPPTLPNTHPTLPPTHPSTHPTLPPTQPSTHPAIRQKNDLGSWAEFQFFIPFHTFPSFHPSEWVMDGEWMSDEWGNRRAKMGFGSMPKSSLVVINRLMDGWMGGWMGGGAGMTTKAEAACALRSMSS